MLEFLVQIVLVADNRGIIFVLTVVLVKVHFAIQMMMVIQNSVVDDVVSSHSVMKCQLRKSGCLKMQCFCGKLVFS